MERLVAWLVCKRNSRMEVRAYGHGTVLGSKTRVATIQSVVEKAVLQVSLPVQ